MWGEKRGNEKSSVLPIFGALLLSVWGAKPAVASGGGSEFDVIDVQVTVVPRFESRSAFVTQRMTVRLTQSARALRFMPLEATEPTVEVDGVDAELRITEERTELVLPALLERGTTVSILADFVVTDARGLRFDADGVYAGFHTCTWMLCGDDVADRAEVVLRVHAGPGQRTAGSGLLLETQMFDDGWSSTVWRSRVPLPPFLVGFATAPLELHEHKGAGPQLQFLAPMDVTESAANHVLSESEAMIAFFESSIGVPFPSGVYAQVVVPGLEAQEKAGLALIGRGYMEQMGANPQEDWVIAHELAHQYWGVLLQIPDWSELWLNEGFATFMVAAWKERRWGREAYEREMSLAETRLEAVRRAGFDKPLTWAGQYPDLRTKRAITYSKGALFLHHLRQALGERAFWRGLGEYTRSAAGRVVTTADLQRSLEREAGRSLEREFDLWVYDGGGR